MYDLFFLSHGEPNAADHWEKLSRSQPHAKRVDGIDGILTAHRYCASQALTTNFFVVDADNEILDEMDFGIKLPDYDKQYVHIWRAKNPLNGLVYGWGGIKLFPKKLLLTTETMPVDMTTSFPLKIVDTVGSITHFNSSPFDTWRSAFRECAKLVRNTDQESRERLETWCSIADGPYASECLRGALQGRDFGWQNRDRPDILRSINDWHFLNDLYQRS